MPKIADLEVTPNPNARKFILKEPLTYGVAKSFENAAEAAGDELASKLFAIDHVVSVFYVDNWITVTQDGEADWQELMREVAGPIREAPAAESQSEEFAQAAEWLSRDDSHLSETDRAKLIQINELLDERVRPFLQSDGGDLYVVGLDDNVLQVHYQGACGSCPSSLSGTLAGITGLVRQIDPDLDVVAV
ncbi:MAG: NifU family protein [Betaproteobacteria bacterium]|nr:MAG: NifU family protein [Betaproteobacteria bacterium]